jgi:A/G-specific adenine glycosylase
MLQQTQVDRVIPYYERFLRRFPTVAALAAARTADVIRIWSGLGYNRRAVNLQRAATVVVEEMGGEFPADPAVLKTLPGVGAYTAGAIAAFAYERDVAFADTNMRRVISRVVFGTESAPERDVLEVAAALVPSGQGWAWNQALIEFGALQCTSRRPACVVCPLHAVCAAYPAMQTTLSGRRRRSARPHERFEQSSRFYRGRVVAALRAMPESDSTGVELEELGRLVRDDYSSADRPWLQEIVEGLQRDGLAVIAEDRPAYDAGENALAINIRVRLP